MASLGVQPDAWGYSAAIAAFGQTGRTTQALELFRAMPRSVPPDNHCFSAAMGACRRANDSEGVLRLYAQLLATGAQPNSYTLNAAVAACAATPELGWKRALQLLVSAPADAADVHVFTSALSACSRAGRWREATALLGRMEQQRVAPNAHSYCAAIAAHERDVRRVAVVAVVVASRVALLPHPLPPLLPLPLLPLLLLPLLPGALARRARSARGDEGARRAPRRALCQRRARRLCRRRRSRRRDAAAAPLRCARRGADHAPLHERAPARS